MFINGQTVAYALHLLPLDNFTPNISLCSWVPPPELFCWTTHLLWATLILKYNHMHQFWWKNTHTFWKKTAHCTGSFAARLLQTLWNSRPEMEPVQTDASVLLEPHHHASVTLTWRPWSSHTSRVMLTCLWGNMRLTHSERNKVCALPKTENMRLESRALWLMVRIIKIRETTLLDTPFFYWR